MRREMEIIFMVVRRESSKPLALFYEREEAEAYVAKVPGVRDMNGQVTKPVLIQSFIRKEDGRLLQDCEEPL